ncbi:phage tail protein [Desulfuromonas thiophila]|uniref:phage tail protein n=1 Tax=Desulfuromonas thiophila TaxID=57664 RepID=UPI0029F4BD8A|nr:phage tail protein [Desulfuromonas thiophila]
MTDLTLPGLRASHIQAFDGLMDQRWPLLPLQAVLSHQIDQAPAEVLPHLAERFHLAHTVAWRRATTDARRRYLITDAVRRHRLKGTLAGLRLAAEDAGAAVTRAVVPPSKLFAAPPLTITERNALLARCAQLRLYPLSQRGAAGRGSFVARHRQRYLVGSDAAARLGERVVIWRPGQTPSGVETAVRLVAPAADEVVLTVPGRAAPRAGFVAGVPSSPRVSDAAARLYRVRLVSSYSASGTRLHQARVRPGVTAQPALYEYVAERGSASSLLLGAAFTSACSVHNSGHGTLAACGAAHSYRRLYLFEPSLACRRSGLHLNEGILTMPAHHARLDVRLRGRRDPLRLAGSYLRGWLGASSQQALSDCLAALRDAARASDVIAIATKHARPAVAGAYHLAGTLVAGALTERK